MALKKIFSLLVTLSLCTAPVLALQGKAVVDDGNVIAPKWSEFCPSVYLNGKLKSIDEYKNCYRMPYCRSEKKWVKAVSIITVIPALDCWSSGLIYKGQIIAYNRNIGYWNNRKKQFDAAIATCASAPKEQQAGCYMQVRQLELQIQQNETLLAQNKLMQKQINSQNISTLNSALQGIQMNNSLRSINSNLNGIYNKY